MSKKWEDLPQFERDCWAVEQVLGGTDCEIRGNVRYYTLGDDQIRVGDAVGLWGGWSVTRWECDGQVMQAVAERGYELTHYWTQLYVIIRTRRDPKWKPPYGFEVGALAWIQYYRPGDYTHAAYLAMEGKS